MSTITRIHVESSNHTLPIQYNAFRCILYNLLIFLLICTGNINCTYHSIDINQSLYDSSMNNSYRRSNILLISINQCSHLTPISYITKELLLRGHNITLAIHNDTIEYMLNHTVVYNHITNNRLVKIISLGKSHTVYNNDKRNQLQSDPYLTHTSVTLQTDYYQPYWDPMYIQLYDSMNDTYHNNQSYQLMIGDSNMWPPLYDISQQFHIPLLLLTSSIASLQPYLLPTQQWMIPSYGTGYSYNNMTYIQSILSLLYPNLRTLFMTPIWSYINKMRLSHNLSAMMTIHDILNNNNHMTMIVSTSSPLLELPLPNDYTVLQLTGPLLPIHNTAITDLFNGYQFIYVTLGSSDTNTYQVWHYKLLADVLLDTHLPVYWSIHTDLQYMFYNTVEHIPNNWIIPGQDTTNDVIMQYTTCQFVVCTSRPMLYYLISYCIPHLPLLAVY